MSPQTTIRKMSRDRRDSTRTTAARSRSIERRTQRRMKAGR